MDMMVTGARCSEAAGEVVQRRRTFAGVGQTRDRAHRWGKVYSDDRWCGGLWRGSVLLRSRQRPGEGVHVDRRPSDSQPQDCGGGTEASRVSTIYYAIRIILFDFHPSETPRFRFLAPLRHSKYVHNSIRATAMDISKVVLLFCMF